MFGKLGESTEKIRVTLSRLSTRALLTLFPCSSNLPLASVARWSTPNLVCVPDPNIIWVCESPAIILYGDVAIFPRFGGKRDVTHLIYVKIKPYLISLLFLEKMAWFQTFPSKRKRRN